ncbi:Cyclic nucleotide-binding domain-containing protein [Granulicella rosea]|uniref:Cyclic nucleotide-binding domain-containing protein n=1 Tax=Granulicella rosea TaxID=474952 RepID=A0A239KA59_9BACT|nr:cyclic nucleotide-binding domain-containing protein [Granulicella rosea]SNT14533.1 Cyclic nucleotide-binding domain-containing protein [Granulicella rosea]
MNRQNRALSMVERSMEEARLTQPILPPIAQVEQACFLHLENMPTNLEIAPGTVLVEQGAHPRAVSLLARGLVRLVVVDDEGRQTTLGLRSTGWYAGAVQAIMNAASPYTVVAVTSCSISSIPAVEFSLKLTQNATLMQHFVAVLCNEVSAQTGASTGNGTLSFPACPEMKMGERRPIARARMPRTKSQLAWLEFAQGA